MAALDKIEMSMASIYYLVSATFNCEEDDWFWFTEEEEDEDNEEDSED